MTTVLMGCAKAPTASVWPLSVQVHGKKDVVLRCAKPSAPISVESAYSGTSLSLTNGTVVIFVAGNRVTGIGWDTADLARGGQVFRGRSPIDGTSTEVPQWWRRLAADDTRFSVVEVDKKGANKAKESAFSGSSEK